MDPTSVAGVALTVALVAGCQWLEGGALRTLAQGAAALVVFGGTAAALLVSFPFETLRRAIAAAARAFLTRPVSELALVGQFKQYAMCTRRRGVLVLERDIADAGDLFLARALELAVDGHRPDDIRRALEIDSRTREDRDEACAGVLEAAAGYAPTMGILGAVLGLIQVMEHLASPSRLGEGIAVAFVATVYGVASANLLFMPLATRMRAAARADAVTRELVIEGMTAIQAGMHPRTLEEQLLAFVAEAGARASVSDRAA
ncbi:MAG: flagellar motor protein [Acidobacteria bacterium]|nr:flagellar motor protein [Acidobacteriota bacterium]